jgi:hypothetical protein
MREYIIIYTFMAHNTHTNTHSLSLSLPVQAIEDVEREIERLLEADIAAEDVKYGKKALNFFFKTFHSLYIITRYPRGS